MQELFSAYLLHRLDTKSRGGIPGHRGGFRGRGRSGGRRGGSSTSGRDSYSGQSSDRYLQSCLYIVPWRSYYHMVPTN